MTEHKISLKSARVNAGLTQKDVAKKMHVSTRTIIDWEKNVRIPSFSNLNMLSNIYRIPVNNIFLPDKST